MLEEDVQIGANTAIDCDSVGETRIKRGAKDFHVRQAAIAILRRRDVRPKDYLGEIKALFEWVQRHVRYTRDPNGNQWRPGSELDRARDYVNAGRCG